MKYIKNLEDKTQSVLYENIADDAAEISGLDKDAVADAIKGLNFSNYLELGNAVSVEDGETIREILNISDVVPEEPMAEIDLEEDEYEDSDEFSKRYGGKSAIVRDVAKEKGWDYTDLPMLTIDDLQEADNISTYKVTFNNGKSRNVKAKDRDEAKSKAAASLDNANPGGSILIIGVKSIKKIKEADNPSAPATASPSAPAARPPSAGSSIDALAQPADTATDVDDQEVQQGRKEVDDLQIGDEIEVADIDGQPAAGRVRNLAGPGDTLVITGKGNEEHMIRKDSILSTPLLPVQTSDGEVIEGLKTQYESALAEKGRQTRLKNTTKLGSKNKRAERFDKKRKLDVDEGMFGEETHADMVDYWKQSLSSSIVSKKVFTQLYTAANNDIDELNAAIEDQANSIADSYHGSGEGIGSSDVNHFIAHIGSSLGIEDLFGWNKPRKADASEGLEEDGSFSFHIDPDGNGGANVMSSNGDIHDHYETTAEALSVAKRLNAEFGKDSAGKSVGVEEEFEHYGSGANFIPVIVNGKDVGVVWQEGEGDWHAEYSKTGASWGMIDSQQEAEELIQDEAMYESVDGDISRLRELAGIKETASGGATGAGAISSSPAAMNGVQKRNPSIYGQTKLKKKPTPKTRITKEDASAGIGRDKKE